MRGNKKLFAQVVNMKTKSLPKTASLSQHEVLVNNRIRNVKKEYGIFFTPERVVDFMVSLINQEIESEKCLTILEPACGLVQFLTGIKKKKPPLFRKARLFGVELNKEIVNYLNTLQIDKKINLIFQDYLLWETNSLFDVIIGNPPYGIPGNSEHYPIKIGPEIKSQYKKLYQTWYGKYNVYGAFIEKSIKLLKENGQLVFIVPGTFMILDEFKKLREFLSRQGTTQLIYMGPDIFKPEADVSSVILNFKKSCKRSKRLKLLEYQSKNKIIQIKRNDKWQGEVVKFETEYTQKIEGLCSCHLADIYDIRVSPRTPEIRIKYRNYIIEGQPPEKKEYLSILNGRNLKCSSIIYENLTGYWIKKSNIKMLRNFFSIPHPVVGLGFRGNGRVGSAYDKKGYPWMGDVYHLLRKDSLFVDNFALNDYEIVEYLNSDYIRRYIKNVYREITYHLSITQLKSIPLPTKKELKQIKEIYGKNFTGIGKA